jgi:hypothetical protein
MNGGEIFLSSSTVGAPGSITSGPIGTNTLTFAANTELSSITNNVTLANAISLGAFNLDNDDATTDLALTGLITGVGGSITWCTNNVLELDNSNTFSGGIDMREGTLLLGSNSAAGTGTIILDTATSIDASGPGGITRTIPNSINVTGGSAKLGTGNNNQLTFSGDISGGTGIAVEIDNGALGSTALTGTNSFTASSFTVDNGIVYAGNSSAFGGASNTVVLDDGSKLDAQGSGVARTLPNQITISGSTAQFGTGNNNQLTFSGLITGTGPSVVTIDNGPSGSVTLSGGSTLSGTGTSFNVNNGGTVFAANSTAFGAATNQVIIQGGSTLNVLGGVTIQNPITVGSGANTLAGSGTIANGGSALPITNYVILSPSLSPGGGPGDLTFTNPLIFTGGAFHFQLYNATGTAGSDWGEITATGGMNFSGAAANSITFNVVSVNNTGGSAATLNFNPATSYSWTFATSPTAITGFNSADFNIITSGFSNSTGGGGFSVSEVGNSLELNFTPVPEPSTWALLGGGVLVLVPMALRRRRLRKA